MAPPRTVFRWIWWPIKWAGLLLVGYLLACTILLFAYRWVNPPVTTVQLQRLVEAALNAEPYRIDYEPLDSAEMALVARRAAIASEDARFYGHNGFDMIEIEAAREAAARGRPLRGASTITQQTVKNLFLTTHRSWIRKGLEVPLTFLAEWILPKERILTLYLNVAEWGPGVFGVEAASKHHYGVTAANLSRDRATRLVACLPDPLGRRPQQMTRMASRIQRRMRQMGY